MNGDRGWVYAVPRVCGSGAPDCAAVCRDPALRQQDAQLVGRNKDLTCFNSLHVYASRKLPQSATGQLGYKIARYNSCEGGCGSFSCTCPHALCIWCMRCMQCIVVLSGYSAMRWGVIFVSLLRFLLSFRCTVLCVWAEVVAVACVHYVRWLRCEPLATDRASVQAPISAAAAHLTSERECGGRFGAVYALRYVQCGGAWCAGHLSSLFVFCLPAAAAPCTVRECV